MRHVHHRRHINLRHFDEPVEPRLVKFAISAKAGVVHEQINRNILFFGKRKNLLRAEGLRQIRDADERADVMLAAQFRREADEPVAPPRRQHQGLCLPPPVPAPVAVPIPALAPVINAHLPCQ